MFNIKNFTFIIFLILTIYILLNSIYIYEGYKNFIEEVVRRGYQKARLFGYPTANIRNSINLPCGVYQGSTNYNKSATIYSNNSDELECHIHEFNKNIYDKKLTINNIRPIENTGYSKGHLCELAKVFIN